MLRKISLKFKFVAFTILIMLFLIIVPSIARGKIVTEAIFVFSLIFFIIVAGYIFILGILNPIEKYKIAIDRALRGQYIEIETKSGDEVGQLGLKLSKLVDKLKRRDLENYIISRIDHILISNIKIEDSAEEILKILKEALGYYRFSIYLVDKEEQKFYLLKSIGFEDKYLIKELPIGVRGLINYAYMFRTSVYSPDVLKDERYIQEHPSIRSEFDIPLMIGDEVIGILNVESDKVDGIKPEDREFLLQMAVQIATAFRNSQFYNQAIERLKQLNLLNKVSQAIGFKLDIQEILRAILNLMIENYGTRKIAVLLREENGSLKCAISLGLSDQVVKSMERYVPWRSESGATPIIITDIESEIVFPEFEKILKENGIKSVAFFPIVHREKFIGRLDIYFDSRRKLKQEEIEFGINVCGEIASAIENARLFELLKSSEKFIRTVLENAPIGIMRLDNQGRLLYLNSEMRRIVGISGAGVSELTGQRIDSILNLEGVDAEFFKDSLMKGERVKRWFVPFKSVDGKEMFLIVDVEPIFSSGGLIDGYVVIARDVTAEERLQHERLKLGKVIEGLNEAVMITDINGNIEYVNPAFERITGYKLNEVIGKNPRFLKSGKQDRNFYAKMWETILKGEIWEGELINRKKNGDLYYEYMSITPLFDSKGNITNFVAIKRDITEQKLFEAQILQFQKLESVGSISSGIAHDFNNVLASIQAGIKVLQRRLSSGDPEILKVLDIIKKSAERGADITRRLLNFVRREVGKPSFVDVRDLVDEIKTLIVHSFPENIKFESFVDENVKFINVDYGQIVQALMNLCINARDAMPNGGVLRIVAKNISSNAIKDKFPNVSDGDYVVIAVSDTGVGIPEEVRDKIFEPFFTTKPPEKGTGLGLPIVLKIIASHAGFITYETETGKGTTFYIYLPAVERKVEVVEEFKVEKLTTAVVMIVEDEESLRYLLKEYLESRGHTVIATDDGYDAIELYKMNMGKIDIVILDIGLPTIDGITTFRKIRQIDPNATVVLTSGYFLTEPSPATLMAEEGLDGFIQKPYDVDKIEFLIERFVRKREVR